MGARGIKSLARECGGINPPQLLCFPKAGDGVFLRGDAGGDEPCEHGEDDADADHHHDVPPYSILSSPPTCRQFCMMRLMGMKSTAAMRTPMTPAAKPIIADSEFPKTFSPKTRKKCLRYFLRGAIMRWLWGRGSVGRAMRSQRIGQGFESPRLHHHKQTASQERCRLLMAAKPAGERTCAQHFTCACLFALFSCIQASDSSVRAGSAAAAADAFARAVARAERPACKSISPVRHLPLWRSSPRLHHQTQ